MSEYRNHISRTVLLSPHYAKHVSAMTGEDLYGKGEIAEELAARDMEIERLREEVQRLSAPQPPAVSAEPVAEVVGRIRNALYEVRTLCYDLPVGTKLYLAQLGMDAKDAALTLAKETLENLVGVDATERLMTKEAVAVIDAAMQKGGA